MQSQQQKCALIQVCEMVTFRIAIKELVMSVIFFFFAQVTKMQRLLKSQKKEKTLLHKKIRHTGTTEALDVCG